MGRRHKIIQDLLRQRETFRDMRINAYSPKKIMKRTEYVCNKSFFPLIVKIREMCAKKSPKTPLEIRIEQLNEKYGNAIGINIEVKKI